MTPTQCIDRASLATNQEPVLYQCAPVFPDKCLVLHEGGFPWLPGSAIPSGIGLAPSLASFSSVCFLLCSITRLCLKYVTCEPPKNPLAPHLKPRSPCLFALMLPLTHPLPVRSFLSASFPFPNATFSPSIIQKKTACNQHTQLAAHSFSNPFPSSPHTLSARSFSRMLWMMPLRSRHAKN